RLPERSKSMGMFASLKERLVGASPSSDRLVGRAECRPRNPGEDLLLVVDGSTLVGRDAGGIVRGHEQRVDVAPRVGKTEVIANERVGRARIAVRRASQLANAVDMLVGIHRIPGVVRNTGMAADWDRAAARVRARLRW